MAPRTTRSKPAKALRSENSDASANAPLRQQITRVENEQHRLFILPAKADSAARIVTLPHPASGSLSRYLYCPKTGLSEFTKVTSARQDPQSCLIARESHVKTDQTADHQTKRESVADGYILEDANFFVATPVDPAFLLWPLFSSTSPTMFRMSDDHLETLSDSSTNLARMLKKKDFEQLLLDRLASVSQVQDLGEDKLYKPDLELFATLLVGKAKAMIAPNVWPASIEDALVLKQLDVPVVPIARVDAQLPTPEESQENPPSEISDTKDRRPEANASIVHPRFPLSDEIIKQMRLQVAYNYMLTCYAPLKLRKMLEEKLSTLVDLSPLEAHLATVRRAKAEVQALRSLSDNISRKRGFADDDEAAEARAEKKRKKDEEESRKRKESIAIKQLKKVDTSGMKKMSSFFTTKTKT